MDIRKLFLTSILLLIHTLYAQSNYDGVWVDEYTYNWIINNESMGNYAITNDYSWNNAKYYPNSSLIIDTETGSFFSPNLFGCKLEKIELEDEIPIIFLTKDYETVGYQWKIQLFIHEVSDCMIWLDFNDEIVGQTSDFGNSNYWYRISSPSVIPIQPAVVNDSRIRVRTLPNLDSDTWGYLNIGDFVKIKDKSDEPYEIEGESWYWYKVESENLPDGWVYGKYLDVKESNYENSKLAVNEKISKLEKLKTLYSQSNQIKRNSQNSKIEDNETFSDPKKKKYSYFGNTFDEKERILTITNNKILLPFNLTIGQTESDIRENFGEPDTINKNTWLFLEGTKFKYTAIFYLNDGILTKIEVKYEY